MSVENTKISQDNPGQQNLESLLSPAELHPVNYDPSTDSEAIFASFDFPPRLNYAQALSAGRVSLRRAIATEEEAGLDMAAEDYQEAQDHFNWAMMISPCRSKSINPLDDIDPFLLLDFATCIGKKADYGISHDKVVRREELRDIAKSTLQAAEARMLNPKDITDRDKALGVLTVANILGRSHEIEAAEDAVQKLEELIDPIGDTQSLVLEEIKRTDTVHPLYIAYKFGPQAHLELIDSQIASMATSS